ncbi:MAG: Holliday junction DNA helicase RuvA [Proteobacteria bacterium]|nr:Holliday junction DNA helicase RuvA [Desulfobacula sp.]MBU4131676.1 Holliday junction DNA helicase RuvA [Pseudomonadota bacterium]
MIGYLEGQIIHHDEDSILLLAGHVGYEILLNPMTLDQVKSGASDDGIVSLYIYYHVTDRQPKPVLIGFGSPEDKEFFQLFISVSAVGPMKAVKALTRPVTVIANAIEEKDVSFLSQLSGIGKRTAEKIIATLHGKVTAFLGPETEKTQVATAPLNQTLREISQQVEEVLVDQLGHSVASARRMIKEAFDRNPSIETPEALFDEIYREVQ